MTSLTLKLKENPCAKGMLTRIGYRRTTCRMVFADSVELHGRYWDGGSISRYALVDIIPSRVTPLPQVSPPQFGGPREVEIKPIAPGQAVISYGTFCGKPSHATIYMRKADALIWLGAEVSLTLESDNEKA